MALGLGALLLVSCDRPPTRSTESASGWEAKPEGGGAWIAVYFNDVGDPCFSGDDPVRRWRRVREAGTDPRVEEGLRLAMAALRQPAPEGLFNPLEDVRLELLSARLSDGFLELNFSQAFQEAGANGSSHGCARASTFYRTVSHYYPQARSVCILIEGEDPEAIGLFHDTVSGCSEDEP